MYGHWDKVGRLKVKNANPKLKPKNTQYRKRIIALCSKIIVPKYYFSSGLMFFLSLCIF